MRFKQSPHLCVIYLGTLEQKRAVYKAAAIRTADYGDAVAALVFDQHFGIHIFRFE